MRTLHQRWLLHAQGTISVHGSIFIRTGIEPTTFELGVQYSTNDLLDQLALKYHNKSADQHYLGV